MKVIYVSFAISGNPLQRDDARNKARRWVMAIADLGFAPVAAWILLSGDWVDGPHKDLSRVNAAVIRKCDELWLCGSMVTADMETDASDARDCGIQVRDLTGFKIEDLSVLRVWA